MNSKADGYGKYSSSPQTEVGPGGKKIHPHIYEGEWMQDKKHGKGREVMEDGCVYEGEYKDGVRHGEGKYTFEDGSVYQGYWLDNMMEGYGDYKFASGRVYEGEFHK